MQKVKTAAEIEALLDGDEGALISAINVVAGQMMGLRKLEPWHGEVGDHFLGGGEAETLRTIELAAHAAADTASHLGCHMPARWLFEDNEPRLLCYIAEREARIVSIAARLQLSLVRGYDNLFQGPRVRDHSQHIARLMRERESFVAKLEALHVADEIKTAYDTSFSLP